MRKMTTEKTIKEKQDNKKLLIGSFFFLIIMPIILYYFSMYDGQILIFGLINLYWVSVIEIILLYFEFLIMLSNDNLKSIYHAICLIFAIYLVIQVFIPIFYESATNISYPENIILPLSSILIMSHVNITLVFSPYICWANIPSSYFKNNSIEPLKYNKTQVSLQRNLIFSNKNMTYIYWYQFVFAINKINNKNITEIEVDKWSAIYGVINNKFIYLKEVTLNMSNIKNITYNITGNEINVFFLSYNLTGKQKYEISEKIPNGVQLSNSSQNNSIINKYGFYTSKKYNYEIDIFNKTLYNIMKNEHFLLLPVKIKI